MRRIVGALAVEGDPAVLDTEVAFGSCTEVDGQDDEVAWQAGEQLAAGTLRLEKFASFAVASCKPLLALVHAVLHCRLPFLVTEDCLKAIERPE